MLCACVVVISLKEDISLKEYLSQRTSLSKCLMGASSSRRFSNSYFFPPFHYWYATSCFDKMFFIAVFILTF